MKKILLFALLMFPLLASGAVKGDGATGKAIWGNGSSGCAGCLPHLTSYSGSFWVKNVGAAHNGIHQAVYCEVAPCAGVQSYWLQSTGHEYCAIVGIRVDLGEVTNGRWYHVGCVWDGTLLHGYLNGIEIGTTSATSTLDGTAGLMVAYAYFPGSTDISEDTLAELALWVNLVLTPNEIKALASGTNPTTLRPPTVYSTLWGTGAATGSEADLSGCFQNTGCGGVNSGAKIASNVSFGVYYTSGTPNNFGGFSLASHAPVRPFSTAEEGSW